MSRRTDQRANRVVVGVAWYRREQWPRLLEVSIDRDELEDRYDDWLEAMPRRLEEVHRAGHRPVKVDVDLDELMAWCERQGREVDSAARAEFVARKLRDLGAQRAIEDTGA